MQIGYLNPTYWLCALLALVLHECGHVLACYAVGLKVRKVGICLKGPYTRRQAGTPIQNFVVTASGPLVNFLALFLFRFFPTFAFVSFVVLLIQLIPLKIADGPRAVGYLLDSISGFIARLLQKPASPLVPANLYAQEQNAPSR
jgi:hypothetical protein